MSGCAAAKRQCSVPSRRCKIYRSPDGLGAAVAYQAVSACGGQLWIRCAFTALKGMDENGILRVLGILLILVWLVLWLFVKITLVAIHLLLLLGSPRSSSICSGEQDQLKLKAFIEFAVDENEGDAAIPADDSPNHGWCHAESRCHRHARRSRFIDDQRDLPFQHDAVVDRFGTVHERVAGRDASCVAAPRRRSRQSAGAPRRVHSPQSGGLRRYVSTRMRVPFVVAPT